MVLFVISSTLNSEPGQGVGLSLPLSSSSSSIHTSIYLSQLGLLLFIFTVTLALNQVSIFGADYFLLPSNLRKIQ